MSPHLGRGIAALSGFESDVSKVVALADLFPRDIKDVDYIDQLSHDGPWCIVSIDTFRKHHGAEREALRQGGHTAFVLERQWASAPFWLKAERLVRWWPQIIAQAKILEGGMLSVPFAHKANSRFKQIRF